MRTAIPLASARVLSGVRWRVTRHRKAAPYHLRIHEERLGTVANGITAARTLLSLSLAAVALAQREPFVLIAAYLAYWIGDMTDGIAARTLAQETRIGAVFDIVADRACTLLCAGACLALRAELAAPVVVYLVEFAVVDTMLCLGFLAFPVKGPNDMHVVDVRLWRWNWSRPAKAVNSALVVLLCLAGQVVAATLLAAALLGIKIWSCARLRGLAKLLAATPR